jgi:uncharacterized protein (DUF736 family)
MYDNTNSGAIFKNEKKADNHPDYKGKINVDGVDKEIALWLRTSKDGKTKFFSVKITDPYKTSDVAVSIPAPKAPEPAEDFFQSDLPF